MAKEDKNSRLHSEVNGQFVEKGDMSAAELKKQLQRELPETTSAMNSAKIKAKSQEEFFGEEFKGVSGAEAIEKLLKEKRGHVKNAFERPEIGGIDLVWGDKNGGLFHAIQKRDRLLERGKGNISGIDMAKNIPEIIDKGEFSQDDDGRLNIDYDGYRVGLMPRYFDKKVNWIVTAMERWK